MTVEISGGTTIEIVEESATVEVSGGTTIEIVEDSVVVEVVGPASQTVEIVETIDATVTVEVVGPINPAVEIAIPAYLGDIDLGYATRADLVAAVAGGLVRSNGRVTFVEGLAYRWESGSTVIPDLPGLAPAVNGAASPGHWGAVSGGVVDCLAALTAAVESGLPVDGWGETFGVAGRLDLDHGSWLEDLTLKQLAPAASQSVITLYALDKNNLTLKNVAVDRNGDGRNSLNEFGETNNAPTNAALATAFGIYIDGGTGHVINDIDVSGDDSGTGIRLINLDPSSKIDGVYVHDIMAVVPGGSSDVVGGISILECNGVDFRNLRVERMGWRNDIGDATTYVNSRMIGISGNTNCTFFAPRASFGGQGIDFSGDLGADGNTDCAVYHGVVTDCDTYCFKLANLQKRVKWYGCTAIRGAISGFVSSASYDDPVTDFDATWAIDCDALDCGNGVGTNGGFLKLDGTRDEKVPFKMLRCNAYDRRAIPLMTFGFYNETDNTATAYTSVADCRVSGAQDTDFRGFRLNKFRAQTNATVSPSGFASDQYVPNSAIAINPNELVAGSTYTCRLDISKTAAGVASPVITVRFGVDAATTDTALVTLALGAQTAAAADGFLDIVAVFRALGPATDGRMSVSCQLTNDGNTVGLATAPISIVRGANSGFDTTLANAYLGISINAGASAAWTLNAQTASLEHPG